MTSRLVRLASDSCKLTADHLLDGKLEVDAEQREDQAKRQATRARKKAMLAPCFPVLGGERSRRGSMEPNVFVAGFAQRCCVRMSRKTTRGRGCWGCHGAVELLLVNAIQWMRGSWRGTIPEFWTKDTLPVFFDRVS